MALPAVLFFDSQGEPLIDQRVDGFILPEEMLTKLNAVLATK
jgi:hypothetical protein